MRLHAVVLAAALLAGCSGGTPAPPPAAPDPARDVLSTDLALDLTTLEGTATITLAGADKAAASFEIGDLEIVSVSDADGPLQFATNVASRLDVGVPTSDDPATLTVQYRFRAHHDFDGWMPEHGVTFLWPYFCGNLFPCKSDPSDGLQLSLAVSGVEAGKQAVFPEVIPADAPSYMIAVAVGDYREVDLGATTSGTRVVAWHLPGEEATTAKGTKHLRDVFDFYETTYGAYTFGAKAGSVQVDWGPGDYGGMEHHPYWHVGKSDFVSEEVHAHEAAHGWFGDGVRIACWEDFVLSEGTVTYLAAHALERSSVDVWPDYACELAYDCDPANGVNTIALPGTCGAIDLLHDPLWSLTTYMKGAYFFREAADVMGADALDAVIGAFYLANVGGAAHMQDLVDAMKVAAGKDGPAIARLEHDWLHVVACPIDTSALCPAAP